MVKRWSRCGLWCAFLCVWSFCPTSFTNAILCIVTWSIPFLFPSGQCVCYIPFSVPTALVFYIPAMLQDTNMTFCSYCLGSCGFLLGHDLHSNWWDTCAHALIIRFFICSHLLPATNRMLDLGQEAKKTKQSLGRASTKDRFQVGHWCISKEVFTLKIWCAFNLRTYTVCRDGNERTQGHPELHDKDQVNELWSSTIYCPRLSVCFPSHSRSHIWSWQCHDNSFIMVLVIL